MNDKPNNLENPANRRSFIKRGLAIAGTVTAGAGMLANPSSVFGDDGNDGQITKGDIAILKFLNVLELIESDLWLQYAELGGTQDTELPGLTGGSAPYIAGLEFLDPDMPQYIHDNTEDEITHAAFLGAYLESKGAEPADLHQFRNLPSSTATGAQQIGRLTNLMQLTVDTSWWDPVPEPRQQSRSRSLVRVPSSRSESEQRAISRDSPDRCRLGPRRPHPGNRQHGGFSLRIHRARRKQSLSVAGSKSKSPASFTHLT